MQMQDHTFLPSIGDDPENTAGDGSSRHKEWSEEWLTGVVALWTLGGSCNRFEWWPPCRFLPPCVS
jgi:hypothetical protein